MRRRRPCAADRDLRGEDDSRVAACGSGFGEGDRALIGGDLRDVVRAAFPAAVQEDHEREAVAPVGGTSLRLEQAEVDGGPGAVGERQR